MSHIPHSINKQLNNHNGIKNKPSICIIGPGVVGQATGKVFLQKGYRVSFLGRNKEKIEALRKKGFTANIYADFDHEIRYDYDISILTVPTPSVNGKIDLSAMKEASRQLGKLLAKSKTYHVVIVKSTVPPGTTEETVIPYLESYSHKKVGVDFGVCMNPEYLREETAYEDFINSWIVVVGEYDKKSGDIAAMLYKGFSCPYYRVSLREAEMQKYIHNVFNAVKITYFNEIRELCKLSGIEPEMLFQLTAVSAEGMWNPGYGIRNKGAYEGNCLPKDTEALLQFALEQGMFMTVLSAVIQYNKALLKKQRVERNGFIHIAI